MDDASLELGLDLFSDSDISDDSDYDDEESENQRRRHKIRLVAALMIQRFMREKQKHQSKKRRGINLP
jgi:hypothetical protein